MERRPGDGAQAAAVMNWGWSGALMVPWGMNVIFFGHVHGFEAFDVIKADRKVTFTEVWAAPPCVDLPLVVCVG